MQQTTSTTYKHKETEKQHVKKYKHKKLKLPVREGKRDAETQNLPS